MFQFMEENIMFDRVKSFRKIQEDTYSSFTMVKSIGKFVHYFHDSISGRVVRSEPKLFTIEDYYSNQENQKVYYPWPFPVT